MPYTGRPGVDWGSVAQMLNLERQITETQQQQKIQAMQWQGQQDYQTLVDSGIEPREALKRTAPKLFYSDPRGMAHAIAASQSTYGPSSEPVVKTINGRQYYWTGNSWQLVDTTKTGAEDYTTVTTVNPDTKERQTKRVLTSELEAQKKQSDIESATTQYQKASEALGGMGLFNIGKTKNLEALGQAEDTLQKQGIDIPAAAAYAARFRTGQGGAIPNPTGSVVPPTALPFPTATGNVPPNPPQPTRTDILEAPENPKNRQFNQLYKGPNGTIGIWTKDGWKTPSKFSLQPVDVRGNTGTRG